MLWVRPDRFTAAASGPTSLRTCHYVPSNEFRMPVNCRLVGGSGGANRHQRAPELSTSTSRLINHCFFSVSSRITTSNRPIWPGQVQAPIPTARSPCGSSSAASSAPAPLVRRTSLPDDPPLKPKLTIDHHRHATRPLPTRFSRCLPHAHRPRQPCYPRPAMDPCSRMQIQEQGQHDKARLG